MTHDDVSLTSESTVGPGTNHPSTASPPSAAPNNTINETLAQISSSPWPGFQGFGLARQAPGPSSPSEVRNAFSNPLSMSQMAAASSTYMYYPTAIPSVITNLSPFGTMPLPMSNGMLANDPLLQIEANAYSSMQMYSQAAINAMIPMNLNNMPNTQGKLLSFRSLVHHQGDIFFLYV